MVRRYTPQVWIKSEDASVMEMGAFVEALKDRFEGWELIEYLQIPIDVIIDDYFEEVVDSKQDLEEFMNVGD
jgi:hypothetical protein